MQRIEKTVFISYRRTNFPWALAVWQNLTKQQYDVFIDYDGIGSGDFESAILGNIASRAHFLVLLTPSALKRCSEPGDWLRREIETALDSKRNIVPLMLEGFSFSTPSIASQLTGKLALLKNYNGITISPEFFWAAMERLHTKFLNLPLDAVVHPASQLAQQAATRQKAAAGAAPPTREAELTAQQYFERGVASSDPDEEIRFNTEAIRLQPDFSEAFYNRAHARHRKGDLDGALADYNQAIQLKPDYAEAFINRGFERQAKGDLEGALEDYNRAIQLKPDDAEALNHRGRARQAAGDLDGALEDYSQAIQLKPDFINAYYNRGLVFQQLDQPAAATADLQQYLNLGGGLRDGDTEAVEEMIRELGGAASSDPDEEIPDDEEAIQLEPDDAKDFYNRGLERELDGDLDGALEDYTQAIQLRPDYAEAFMDRGDARDEKGDLEGALEDYSQAIRLDPDDDWAFYRRGLLFGRLDQPAAAIADLQQYLKLGGGAREAVEGMIRRLEEKL